MSDHEAFHLLWMIPAAVVVVVAVPVAVAIYAGLRWGRYNDEEVYLHG